MLAACRLAGLSAREGHYAGLNARMQFGATQRPRDKPMRQWRIGDQTNLRPFEAEHLSLHAGRNGNRPKFPDFRASECGRRLPLSGHASSE
jgi:hypothetical protein